MAHRHIAQRKKGGRVYYSGGQSNVAKEAAERKRGGKVKKYSHKYKSGGTVQGSAGAQRLDRRARGGKTGSDKSPFSSAHFKRGGRTKKYGYYARGGRAKYGYKKGLDDRHAAYASGGKISAGK